MIKCVELRFSPILSTTDIMRSQLDFGVLSKKHSKMFDDISECDVHLDKKPYIMALDQSSGCCGVVFKSLDNTHVLLIEIKKKSKHKAIDAISLIEDVLHHIASSGVVPYIVYERPIKSKHFVSTRVLFQLEGMIKLLPKRYKEFELADPISVPLNTWRSSVLFGEYRDYSDKKFATHESICDAFPWVAEYGQTLGSDYDLYEAFGILVGWLLNYNDYLGRPMYTEDAPKLHKYIVIDSESAEEIQSLDTIRTVGYADELNTVWRLCELSGGVSGDLVKITFNNTKDCAQFQICAGIVTKDYPNVVVLAEPEKPTDVSIHLVEQITSLKNTHVVHL